MVLRIECGILHSPGKGSTCKPHSGHILIFIMRQSLDKLLLLALNLPFSCLSFWNNWIIDVYLCAWQNMISFKKHKYYNFTTFKNIDCNYLIASSIQSRLNFLNYFINIKIQRRFKHCISSLIYKCNFPILFTETRSLILSSLDFAYYVFAVLFNKFFCSLYFLYGLEI